MVFFSKLFHVEHSKSKQRDSIVPRGTIIISLVIIVIVWFGNRGLPEFLDQSILERKLQYLSIPVNSPIELLIGEGLGSYTNLLAKKSPGLYLWQLQPLHNVYLLAITEIGLLPILGISVYMWLKWRKNFFKSLKKILIHQKIVIFIAAELALLLVVDHYTWDIEQGQLLFVLLVTILAFAYNYALPKNRE